VDEVRPGSRKEALPIVVRIAARKVSGRTVMMVFYKNLWNVEVEKAIYM
jgi:hypothetical protein